MPDELTVAPVDLRLSDLVVSVTHNERRNEVRGAPRAIKAITRRGTGTTLVHLKGDETLMLDPTDTLVVERGQVVT